MSGESFVDRIEDIGTQVWGHILQAFLQTGDLILPTQSM
jgi:hypothetical protein